MASLSPANAPSVRSHWCKPDPLDRAARRKRQLAVLNRSPYLVVFCVLTAGVGRHYGALSTDKILLIFFFGVMTARTMMLDFRRPTSRPPTSGILIWALLAPMFTINGLGGPLSWAVGISRMVCGISCLWGTVFFLFVVFREPFLRFMEAGDEPASTTPTRPVDDRTASLPPY